MAPENVPATNDHAANSSRIMGTAASICRLGPGLGWALDFRLGGQLWRCFHNPFGSRAFILERHDLVAATTHQAFPPVFQLFV